MDGTLVDSGPNVERAYRWWAQRHGLPANSILALQTGRPHREVMAHFVTGLYLLAARLLDVPPQDCVIFEDAPAGLEAAKRAGIPVIGISPSGDLAGADLTVRYFRDIHVGFDTGGKFFIQRASVDS